MNSPLSVPFFRHALTEESAQGIMGVIHSPFLTTGQVARDTQALICEYLDIPFAKLTNSWTNGAVATLLAMGIGPGDEVIVPAMTFVASANAVELVGAKPVFVDVMPDTLLIDLTAVQKAITPRTRAVIPVHLYGQMVDIAALRAKVGDRIAIIEDAAHCFEGALNGHRPGTYSDAAIFSFYATKNITCGEGGCIVTRSEALFEMLGKTTLHGMSAGADRRFSGAMYHHWDMEVLGTKANLPDLLAALLPPQIKTVDINRQERARLANRYRAAFAPLDQIRLVKQLPGVSSAEHLFPIAITPALRDVFLRRLNEHNIGATVNYNAVTLTTYYRDKYGFTNRDFPVSVAWGASTLSLPLFPGLTTDEQDYVIAKIIEITAEISE